MDIINRLQSIKKLFLDTAPIIYFVENNQNYLSQVQIVFERIDNGLLIGVTSPITLAECLIFPYRLNQIDSEEAFFEVIVNGTNTLFYPISHETAKKAAQLRAHYNVSLMDAFQIATALDAECDAFLTNDSALGRITEIDMVILNKMKQ